MVYVPFRIGPAKAYTLFKLAFFTNIESSTAPGDLGLDLLKFILKDVVLFFSENANYLPKQDIHCNEKKVFFEQHYCIQKQMNIINSLSK